MKYKLIVNKNDNGDFYLQWMYYDPDCGEDLGAIVGEFADDIEDLKRKLREEKIILCDHEMDVAITEITLEELETERDLHGIFIFKTSKEAKQAISLIKKAIKYYKQNSKYLPAWMIKALEQGWVPSPKKEKKDANK